MSQTSSLFVYGTLCHLPLARIVFGRDRLVCVPAVLPGHAVHRARGGAFPLLSARADASAPGLLIRDVDAAEWERLEFYEGGFGYDLRPVEIETDGQKVITQVYFPPEDRFAPDGPWDLPAWEADWADLTLLAAREAMALVGQVDADSLPWRFGPIRARAAARLRAGENMPTGHAFGRDAVRVHDHRRPYSHFFALDEVDLSFRTFSGGESPVVKRAALVAADAVTVLPYDSVRDRVLLIEQFRFGVYLRGDAAPWLFEPPAGRIDAGETPEEAALRELQEEAGIGAATLHRIGDYYPSPAAMTEFLTSFVGLCDLPDGIAGLGGVAHEAEDIRGHLMSFDDLMAMVADGRARNGPLLLSAMWLAQNRDRLRAAD